MFETIKSGGILMIPIILCAVVALFISIERIHYYVTLKNRDRKMMETVVDCLEKMDYSTAEADCIRADTPCSQVIRTAIKYRRLDESNLKEVVQTKMDSVVQQFEHLLSALGTIANISTLLGLLGTVTGNIAAFNVLGNGGSMGDPSALASGIAQALVTTVAGLVVAIPSIIFNSYFNNRVNHLIRDMEADVTQVMFRILGKEV